MMLNYLSMFDALPETFNRTEARAAYKGDEVRAFQLVWLRLQELHLIEAIARPVSRGRYWRGYRYCIAAKRAG